MQAAGIGGQLVLGSGFGAEVHAAGHSRRSDLAGGLLEGLRRPHQAGGQQLTAALHPGEGQHVVEDAGLAVGGIDDLLDEARPLLGVLERA